MRLRLILFSLILLCAPVFADFSTNSNAQIAQAQDIPEGFESYSDRPDILDLKPIKHNDLGSGWEELKRAQLEMVAFLLESRPDQEIYFLARDAELLYDLAKFVAKDDPKILPRLHLLNISRANMNARYVKNYLAQEGISEEALNKGKKILFVDSGYQGSIPWVIERKFPGHQGTFQTQMIISTNPTHPSTRVFLTAINPQAFRLQPAALSGSIQRYEAIPRYTSRSDRFKKVNGRWQPLSSIEHNDNGQVSKVLSRKYMEDLLHYISENAALLEERRAIWKELRYLADKQDVIAIEAKLRVILEQGKNDPFAKAIVRDFIELIEKKHFSENLSKIFLKRRQQPSCKDLFSQLY